MDKVRDIECGMGPSTSAQFDHGDYSNEPLGALQELLKELNVFLDRHSRKVYALGNPPPGSIDQYQSPSHMLKPKLEIDTPKQGISEITTDVLTESPVGFGGYQDHLGKFLRSHVDNIESLLNNLKNPLPLKPPLPPKSSLPVYQTIDDKNLAKQSPSAYSSSRSTKLDRKSLDALTDQFNMLVVISTFTASLIVSFIQLVKDVMEVENRLAFDVGMFLSFLAMGVHFGNIIVAGRGAALTSQHEVMADEGGYDAKYFGHYLELCEQLQFAATILFISSIILLSFFVFSKLTFPIVLLAISSLLVGLVFYSIYWRVSITVRDVKFVARWAKRKFSTQAR
ncbi:hypothetical protein BD779DRAFT_1679672 [Infundibulicybe gibba]|nr:hypothetical protein BD779DRAFT_1679672 [Infundibulicybe gibba]